MSPTSDPIIIAEQGSFTFGGSTLADPDGRTVRVDHGYAQFQVPVAPRDLPIVMWHASSAATWESTFDGREGFQTIFVRRDFSVYVIDVPRSGRAGQTGAGIATAPEPGRDQLTFELWRLGEWAPPAPPRYFANVRLPKDPTRFLDQLLRARYPSTGPEDLQIELSAVVALLDQIGPAILFTHSGSGKRGWLAATRSENVRGIVAFEPVTFVFPTSAPPQDVPTADATAARRIQPIFVTDQEFGRLAKRPIQMIFGDNIATSPADGLPTELWRVVVERAGQFAAAVHAYGGDATILHLPAVGLSGNTHLAMQDANSVEVAELVSRFLEERGLDRRAR